MCTGDVVVKRDEDSLVYELGRREGNGTEKGVCVREVMGQRGDSLGTCDWDALLMEQK